MSYHVFQCTERVCERNIFMGVRNIGDARSEGRLQEIGKKKRKKKKRGKHCRDPGLFRAQMNSPDLNQGPSDLQSDALPPELSRQLSRQGNKSKENKSENKKKQLLSLTVWELPC